MAPVPLPTPAFEIGSVSGRPCPPSDIIWLTTDHVQCGLRHSSLIYIPRNNKKKTETNIGRPIYARGQTLFRTCLQLNLHLLNQPFSLALPFLLATRVSTFYFRRVSNALLHYWLPYTRYIRYDQPEVYSTPRILYIRV